MINFVGYLKKFTITLMGEIPQTLVKSLGKDQLDLLMYGRRSLYPRQFTGELIDANVIKKILEYANTAPNHKRTRPWRFIVFSGIAKENLLDFKKAYYIKNSPPDEVNQNKLDDFEMRKAKVSHIIAINMHRDELHRLPEIEEIAAVSCAVQNMYLSLNTFGIGGYWNTGNVSFSEEMKNYLGLKGEDRCLGFFYLGIVEMSIPAIPKEEVESLISWRDE